MTLEDAMVMTALDFVGVDATPVPPEPRAKFEGLMGYDETAEVKRAMSSWKGISTCGLFIRGLIWRVFHQFKADVDLHEIKPPYMGQHGENTGKVFENLLDLGERCDAIEIVVPGVWPEPGDICFVGLDTKSDGHVWICTDRNGNVVGGVDAGQVLTKNGHQAVRAKAHTWTVKGKVVSDHAVQIGTPDTFQGADKNVSKIIRMARLDKALLLSLH